MKLPRALKRLKKKMLKSAFPGRVNRPLVLKAIKAVETADELISVAICATFRGEKENDLALAKARSLDMKYVHWLILFEKADADSELREYADDMSYELSPFFENDKEERFD